jgi:hypothetical protein
VTGKDDEVEAQVTTGEYRASFFWRPGIRIQKIASEISASGHRNKNKAVVEK